MKSDAMGDSIDLDRLVRLVMTDLGMKTESGRIPPSSPGAPASPSSPVPTTDSSDLTEIRLSARVITLEQLGETTKKARRISVPTGAVVTPSVRDELRKRGVDLVFEGDADVSATYRGATLSASNLPFSDSPGSARVTFSSSTVIPESGGMGGTTALKSDLPTTSLGLLLAFHALPLETVPKNVLDTLRKKGSVTILQNNCVLETSRQLAEQLELFPGTKAILLTRFSAIASAVCNRKTALRALVGEDPARMEDDAKSLGANLLILDPERSGFFRTRQMMERFISLGPAACPSNIRKGLQS